MGTNSKENRKQERKWKPQSKTNGIADWANVNPKILVDAIAVVAHKGGALRFGYTRDGGAYAMGVYGDGEPYTVYIKPDENPDDYLSDLATTFRDL